MGNTSVNDVGSLFASLNIGAQSLAAGKLSNNISQTGAGDHTSFKDILSQNSEKPDTGQKQSGVKTENKTDRPAEKGNTSSDRIAGEDKADAGRAEATDKKQADKSADPKEGNADKTVTKGGADILRVSTCPLGN